MSTSIELRSVSKSYPGASRPTALRVDLAVGRGEILALVGESGSGKTTLLRLASGLEQPDEGEILIGGRLVADGRQRVWIPPEKRNVGLVFQGGALFPHRTVADNIRFGVVARSRKEQATLVAEMLSLVGLSGFQSRFPHELSGGERQRLALARALAPRPDVILLDEPFTSLDIALHRSLRDEIVDILRAIKATTILVTHDPEDALSVGDRVAILREGVIEQHGTPTEVYKRPVNGYCARLFGPANALTRNGGTTEWIRPEHCRLIRTKSHHALPVRVERMRNLGRHLEVTVRPREKDDEEWVVAAAEADEFRVGEEVWLQLRVTGNEE